MLLKNIPTIVSNNYKSLVSETDSGKWASRIIVGLLLIIIPSSFGVVLGVLSPIWMNLLSALISVVGVLTGFSINTIVLLTGHSEEDSYNLQTDVVEDTENFTLYSILVGIVLLITVLIGFIIVRGNLLPKFNSLSVLVEVTGLQLLSVVVYSLMFHYLVTLLVISHRLYSLVRGDAI